MTDWHSATLFKFKLMIIQFKICFDDFTIHVVMFYHVLLCRLLYRMQRFSFIDSNCEIIVSSVQMRRVSDWTYFQSV